MMTFIVSLGKLIGITPSLRKRISDQINLGYVVLSKAKLYWRFLRAFNVKKFYGLLSIWSVIDLTLFCIIFSYLHKIICKFHLRCHFINGKKERIFSFKGLILEELPYTENFVCEFKAFSSSFLKISVSILVPWIL